MSPEILSLRLSPVRTVQNTSKIMLDHLLHEPQFGDRAGQGLLSFAKLFTQRVQVPNNLVLGFWVIVIIVQVLGKYMIIGYLDP